MQAIISFVLSVVFGIMAIFFNSNILWGFFWTFLLLFLGFSFKALAGISPKPLKRIFAIFSILILEPMALLLVYLLSFLSFFYKGPFNAKQKKTPILMVHGYINFASVWIVHLFRLMKKGHGPIYLINLGSPFSGIETFSRKLKKRITKIQQNEKTKDIVLIGHSMGGLVSSHFSLHYPEHANILGIITLGSPLHGTHVAKIGIGKCARQMEINSPLIQSLQGRYRKKLYYQVVTEKDQLVRPYLSGIVNNDPSRILILEDIGHCSLLYASRVSKKIDGWLKKIT